MEPTTDRTRFELPLYTMAEAARIVAVPPSTLAAWAKGYSRRFAGRAIVTGDPVVTCLPTDRRADPCVPFVGLAEALVLSALRRSEVPLQRIRPALAHLQREIGLEHALASRRLYTDGAELLFDYGESHADTPDGAGARTLVVVRSGQRVFADVVHDYLRRIEYGADGYASLIHVPAYGHAQVVADPSRSFGAPIFERGGRPGGRRPPAVLGRRLARRAVGRVRRSRRPARGRAACRIPTRCLTSSSTAASAASSSRRSYERQACG